MSSLREELSFRAPLQERMTSSSHSSGVYGAYVQPGRRLSPAGERPSTPTVLNSLPIRFGPKDPHSPGRMVCSCFLCFCVLCFSLCLKVQRPFFAATLANGVSEDASEKNSCTRSYSFSTLLPSVCSLHHQFIFLSVSPVLVLSSCTFVPLQVPFCEYTPRISAKEVSKSSQVTHNTSAYFLISWSPSPPPGSVSLFLFLAPEGCLFISHAMGSTPSLCTQFTACKLASILFDDPHQDHSDQSEGEDIRPHDTNGGTHSSPTIRDKIDHLEETQHKILTRGRGGRAWEF